MKYSSIYLVILIFSYYFGSYNANDFSENYTQYPTSIPTQLPTVYTLDYKNLSASYDDYSMNLLNYQNKYDLTFNTFIFKDIPIEGTCYDWNLFANNYLYSPIKNSITINTLAVRLVYEDVRNNEIDSIEVECKDANAISLILKSLHISNENTLNHFCGGHNWTIFNCKKEKVFCIDCIPQCDRCPVVSYTIRPCSTVPCNKFSSSEFFSSQAAMYGIFGITYQFSTNYPLVNSIKILEKSSTLTSFKIELNGIGKLTCSAKEKGREVSSLSDMKSKSVTVELLNQIMGATNNNNNASIYAVNLTIQSLIPDTEYVLYCFTQDFYGNMMNITTALKYNLPFTTSCCKNLTFSAGNISIPISSGSPNKFRFFIPGRLKSQCSFQLSSIPTSGVQFIQAKDFLYDTESELTYREFMISATKSGLYRVFVFPIACGNIINPGYMSLDIQGAEKPPLPTSPKTAILTVSAKIIDIVFNFPVQKGNYYYDSFDCSGILTSDFFDMKQCSWLSTDHLRVHLKSIRPTLLRNNNTLTFVGNAVRVACDPTLASALLGLDCQGDYPTMDPQIIYVDINYQDCISPILSFNMQSRLSSCDDLYIDLSASTGSCGKAWEEAIWEINRTAADDANETLGVILENYLNTFFNRTLPQIITVPRQYIAIGEYTFHLTLKNHLGFGSSAKRDISVQLFNEIPNIYISGASYHFLNTWQEYRFISRGNFSSCMSRDKLNVTKLTYFWIIYRDFQIDYVIRSISREMNILHIRPYTLVPGAIYTIQAIVALDSDLSIFNTNSIQIHVKFSDKLIPKIAGNSYMSINSKESFFLDASQSYDIDFPGDSNLDFMWTCQEVKPIFGKNCPEEIVLQNTPTNFIPPDLFSLGMKTFVFTVAISTKNGFVSTSSEVFVTIIGDTIVSSYIDAYQKGLLLLDKVSRNNIFSIESKISASSETSGRLTWLSNDFDPDALQESALTHLSVTAPPGSLGGVIFALPANTLMPGAVYTFTLQVKSQKKFQNEAIPDSFLSVQVIVNTPPSIDSFTILPSFGYTLQTNFNFLASNYWDEPQDYPLSFRFVCYHISPRQFMLMQDKSFNPSYSSLLPIGLKIVNSPQLTCSVNIYDMYSDYSTLTQKVQIFPIDSNSLTTAINSSLSTALSINDITSQELIFISVLTSAYSYDCSVTSSVLCGTRNRFPCRFPANTCGNCLPGFFGILGPSNTACVDGKYNVNTISERVTISSTTANSPQSSLLSSSSSSSSSHKYIRTSKERDDEQDRNTHKYRSVSVQSTQEPIPGSEGTNCVKDEDCYSGACTLMNDGTYACSENGNKPCPGSPTIQECSRKGVCTYYGESNSTLPTCSVFDFHCRARCECKVGFGGKDCFKSTLELSTVSQQNEMMCASLNELKGSRDMSVDLLIHRASMIATLLSEPALFNKNGFTQCARYFLDTIYRNLELLVRSEAVEIVLSSLSTMLDGNYPSPGLIENDLTQEILTIINYIADNLSVLRTARFGLYELPLFRLRVVEDYVFNTQDSIYYLGRSDIEATTTSTQYAKHSYIQIIQNNQTNLLSHIRMSFLQYALPRDIYNFSDSYYSQVRFVFKSIDTEGFERSNNISFVVNFVNRLEVNYTEDDFLVFKDAGQRGKTFCRKAKLPYKVTQTCYGKDFTLECSGKEKGFYLYNCSTFYQNPVCQVFEHDGFAECKLKDFSSTETTCECMGRALNVVSYPKIYFKPFASVFLNSPDHTMDALPEINMLALVIILAGIVGCFILFFIYLHVMHPPLNKLHTEKRCDLITSYSNFIRKCFPRVLFYGSFTKRFSIYFETYHTILTATPPVDPFKSKFKNFVDGIFKFGYILQHFSLSVLLATFTFNDDGTCESITDSDICVNYSIFANNKLCTWSDLHLVCYYDFSIATSQDVAGYIVILSVLNVLLTYILRSLTLNISYQLQKVNIAQSTVIAKKNSNNLSIIETGTIISTTTTTNSANNKMKNLTTKMRLFLAAKHDMMSKKIDRLPKEELSYFLKHNPDLNCDHISQIKLSTRLDFNIFVQLKNLFFYCVRCIFSTSLIIKFDSIFKSGLIYDHLKSKREISRKITQKLLDIPYDNLREMYLMREYFVHSLDAHHKTFYEEILLYPFKLYHTDRDSFEFYFRAYSPYLLVFYLSIHMFIVIYLGRFLANDSFIYTVIIFAALFVYDVFCAVPTKLLSQFIFLECTVYKYAKRLLEILEIRGKYILQRTSGIIISFNDRLHHFNPACRAARMYPSLLASKWCMSLNDADFTLTFKAINSLEVSEIMKTFLTYVDYFLKMLELIFRGMSSFFLVFPTPIRVLIVDIIIHAMMAFIILLSNSDVVTLIILCIYFSGFVLYALEVLGFFKSIVILLTRCSREFEVNNDDDENENENDNADYQENDELANNIYEVEEEEEEEEGKYDKEAIGGGDDDESSSANQFRRKARTYYYFQRPSKDTKVHIEENHEP